MVDRNTFLAAILDRPDDDAPRLVFADWLEEQGEAARAQLIRVQIELSHHAGEADQVIELRRTEKLLLRQYADEWLRPIHQRIDARRSDVGAQRNPEIERIFDILFSTYRHPPLRIPFTPFQVADDTEQTRAFVTTYFSGVFQQHPLWQASPRFTFRRGFPEIVALLAADFLQLADVLFETAPIREIHVQESPFRPGFLALFESPWIQKISGLELHGELIGPTLDAYLNSRNLEQLSLLNLQAAIVLRDEAPRLAGQDNAPATRRLNLAHLSLGDAAWTTLAHNPAWCNLRSLNLAQTGGSDAGLRELASSRHFTNLEVLLLHNNHITPAGVMALLEFQQMPKLCELDLRFNHLGDSMMQSLSRWTSRVFGGRIASPWVQKFVESPLAKQLKCLRLTGNHVPREDRIALQERFGDRLRWHD